ncbi:MAG: hypothetical protein K8J08_14475 [Thermoanaerobaculia bacterium]|nr:hypothetical protein [Thermoanaerobaculia bacterium]
MTRFMFASVLFAAMLLNSTHAGAEAYIRGATPPWNETTNEAAMDAAFGAGNWSDLRMADGPAPFLPGSGHNVIFLEGSDDTALELAAYLAANQATIEAWVSDGGRLLLNSAPNEGGNINFGFGGITLQNGFFADGVTAADASHPVFQGPLTPVVTDYTGNSFSHGVVDGGGLAAIILGTAGGGDNIASLSAIGQDGGGGGDPTGLIVLGEVPFGNGLLLAGGMTTNNFHEPLLEAANLRANILFYLADATLGGPPVIAIPTLSGWGLVVLILGISAVAWMRMRRISA